MNVNERIQTFDFDNASPHDLAVLLEQVFLYHDTRSRGGGPIIVAQGVIRQYEEAVRRKAAPELHAKTGKHLREMRSTLVQFETTLRGLEADASSPAR